MRQEALVSVWALKTRKFLSVVVGLFLCLPVFGDEGMDWPHVRRNGIVCTTCHNMKQVETYYPDCEAMCHNISNPGVKTVSTHSSATTSTKYGTWGVQCRTCHNPHVQPYRKYGAAAYLISGTSTAVTETTLTQAGANWTVDAYKGLVVLPNTAVDDFFTYKILGNTADTLNIEGPVNLDLASAGNTFAITYGKLIKDLLPTPNNGYKPVKFLNKTGPNSFADGDATLDGVCEVCHTQPTHFRNDGSGSDQIHTNVGGPSGTAGQQCTASCHTHANAFAHGAGGSGGGTGCDACHGKPDDGNGGGGKGTWRTHSTHTQNSAGYQRGPAVTCDACHNTSSFPNFADGVLYTDYKSGAAMTTVCNNCHSPGGTYDGVNDPEVGAKANWKTSIYDGDNLKPGKEKWCATCHDESPSVIQGVNAPSVIGDESGEYTYGTGWGFYKTGHGLPATETYPSSGGITAGAGKQCADCHDLSLRHIDGAARTFDCGADGLSCDSTEYRDSYRLQLIGGQVPMAIPVVWNATNDNTLFRLCYSCHDSTKFTDSSNMNTNFVTTDAGGTLNRHEYHLNLFNQKRYPADYNYSVAFNSRIACPVCHNVHGTKRLAMVNDGKLIDREPGLQIWYDNPMVTFPTSPPTQDPPVPDNIPLASSTGTLVRYGNSSNLCSNCHLNNNILQEARTPFQNLQVVPKLTWTGLYGYESDGVNPDIGAGANGFTFRVTYTDGNNDAPVTAQVWVDVDDNGFYDGTEMFDMVGTSPGDTLYYDSKNYTYTLPLAKVGDNNITYRFEFADAQGSATGAPASNNTLTIINAVPELSWTGESHFVSDGAHPDISGSGTNFTFRVDYKDTDNEAPTLMQVWVDTDDSGTYEGGEQFNMTAVDSGDTNYADGKRYEMTLALSHANDGTLNYQFQASDGTANATGSPVTGSSVVVTSASNNAPTLAWSGEADYTLDGVDPNTGVDGSYFTFRVKYSDIDNNAPTSIQVWIDEDDNGGFDAGEKYDMTLVASADDYTDGRIYTHAKIITHLSDGNYKYRFYATDGLNDATGTPANDGSNLLTVSTACAVVCPSLVGNCSHTSVTTAVSACGTGSYILVKDGTYNNQNISFTNKEVVVRSLNGAAVTILDGGAAAPVITFNNAANSKIDGLTLQNGYGTGTYGEGGGGILVKGNATPTIRNSVITNNSTPSNTGGGGVMITGGSSGATIVNTTITANSANHGGGIGFRSSSGTLDIRNSTISANTSSTDGGGIYLQNVTTAMSITDTTITGNTTNQYGGGIYEQNAALSLENSHVDGNFATGTLGDGAGIFLYGTSGGPYTSTLSNSTVNGNKGYRYGGGIRIWSNSAAENVTISNSTIDNNVLTGQYGQGGGILLQGSNAALTISNSSVSNNATFDVSSPIQNYAGGIYLASTSQPISITGSTINNNRSHGSGGGIYAQDATGGLTVTETSFDGNVQSKSDNYGGALLLLRSPLTMSRTLVRGNDSAGGGGGIMTNATQPVTIESSIVTGNRANTREGGGLYLLNSTNTKVVNTTVAANTSQNGGGIYFNGGTSLIKNSVFWGNDAPTINKVFMKAGTLTVTVTYSDVQGAYTGTGNVNMEPGFIEERAASEAPTVSGNYRLDPSARVINRGTSDESDGVIVPTTDIDGQPRPRMFGDLVDMGADEYAP